MRGALAALGALGLLLTACGGTKAAAPTTTTTLPTTLPTHLSAVESFLTAQGAGTWVPGDSQGTLYNEVGDNSHIACTASINGPKGTTQVSLFGFTCALGSAPGVPTTVALVVVSTVRQFVPAAVTWAQGVLTADAQGTHMATYGGVLVTVGIGGVRVQGEGIQPTLNLSIQATGYRPPPL